MANSASSKKRARQAVKHTLRNRVRRERLRKALKSFHLVIQEGDPAKAAEALKTAARAVDDAGDKGILHANAVNRKKSRLAKAVQKLGAAAS